MIQDWQIKNRAVAAGHWFDEWMPYAISIAVCAVLAVACNLLAAWEALHLRFTNSLSAMSAALISGMGGVAMFYLKSGLDRLFDRK